MVSTPKNMKAGRSREPSNGESELERDSWGWGRRPWRVARPVDCPPCGPGRAYRAWRDELGRGSTAAYHLYYTIVKPAPTLPSAHSLGGGDKAVCSEVLITSLGPQYLILKVTPTIPLLSFLVITCQVPLSQDK